MLVVPVLPMIAAAPTAVLHGLSANLHPVDGGGRQVVWAYFVRTMPTTMRVCRLSRATHPTQVLTRAGVCSDRQARAMCVLREETWSCGPPHIDSTDI